LTRGEKDGKVLAARGKKVEGDKGNVNRVPCLETPIGENTKRNHQIGQRRKIEGGRQWQPVCGGREEKRIKGGDKMLTNEQKKSPERKKKRGSPKGRGV